MTDNLRQAPPGAKRAAGSRLASQVLADAGQELFGDEWATPLAKFIGANERTVRRVRAAAREEKEYPGAYGLLAALQERLAAFLKDLHPFARREPRKEA